jgi:uncharacterized phage protein gp47/JayE
MATFTPKRYKEIRQRMINRAVARTEFNDVTATSDYGQLLSAAAREDDDQYVQMIRLRDKLDMGKAVGEDLDELAERLNSDLISRQTAFKATTNVVFSRVNTTGAKTVYAGTEVQVPGEGLIFVTLEDGTAADGVASTGNVSVQAKAAGTDYNVDPDTITGFVNKPSGFDSVTNPAAVTNGSDRESNDAFRARILLFLKSLSRATPTALEYAALSTTDSSTGERVVYAAVVEDIINRGEVTIYVDDGTGTIAEDDSVTGETVIASATGGEVDLYLDNVPVNPYESYTIKLNASPLTEGTDYTLDKSRGHIKLTTALSATDTVTADYTYYTGLIAECQKIVNGDPNDRENYPGYRAAGVRVSVLPPTVVWMTYVADITVQQGYSQTAVATKVEAYHSNYTNTRGMGEDIIYHELVKRAMSVAGMHDIVFRDPEENRIITDSQLARVQSGAIAVN